MNTNAVVLVVRAGAIALPREDNLLAAAAYGKGAVSVHGHERPQGQFLGAHSMGIARGLLTAA